MCNPHQLRLISQLFLEHQISIQAISTNSPLTEALLSLPRPLAPWSSVVSAELWECCREETRHHFAFCLIPIKAHVPCFWQNAVGLEDEAAIVIITKNWVPFPKQIKFTLLSSEVNTQETFSLLWHLDKCRWIFYWHSTWHAQFIQWNIIDIIWMLFHQNGNNTKMNKCKNQWQWSSKKFLN